MYNSFTMSIQNELIIGSNKTSNSSAVNRAKVGNYSVETTNNTQQPEGGKLAQGGNFDPNATSTAQRREVAAFQGVKGEAKATVFSGATSGSLTNKLSPKIGKNDLISKNQLEDLTADFGKVQKTEVANLKKLHHFFTEVYDFIWEIAEDIVEIEKLIESNSSGKNDKKIISKFKSLNKKVVNLLKKLRKSYDKFKKGDKFLEKRLDDFLHTLRQIFEEGENPEYSTNEEDRSHYEKSPEEEKAMEKKGNLEKEIWDLAASIGSLTERAASGDADQREIKNKIFPTMKENIGKLLDSENKISSATEDAFLTTNKAIAGDIEETPSYENRQGN
jgi:hypothetical protein